MSTDPPIEVPPDTSSWEEAVTHGYQGQRTDPLPDEVYAPEFDPETITATLTAVDPASIDPAVEGGWELQCTGTFPVMDKTQWSVVIVAADGSEWPSRDILAESLESLIAYEWGGPNYPDAAGEGYVVLRHGTEDVSDHLPFTWDYQGRPAGGPEE